jgi:hypothetical protein
MKMKECSFCPYVGPIYKNGFIDGIKVRMCKSCAFKQQKPVETKPRKALNPISKKQSARSKEYNVKRLKFLMENTVCQAALPGCTYHAVQVHHREGRGEKTTDEKTFVAICHNCHTSVHFKLSREERNEKNL